MSSHMKASAAVASVIGVAMAMYMFYHWLKPKRRQRLITHDAVVVETKDALETAMTKIVEDTTKFKVIGLDCEWCSEICGRRRPVALLQIASASGLSVLVRLCKLDCSQLPDSLKDLLADRSILKVGVAVLDDANHLLKDYHLITRGCLDLRHLAYRHMHHDLRSKVTGGLKNLAEVFLKKSLDKSDDIRCGNWEADSLTCKQVHYAAQDAVVAVEIFLEIIHRKLSITPEHSAVQFWSEVGTMCQGLLDVKYKSKASERKTDTNVLRLEREKPSPKLGNAYQPRKTPKYHNCRLLAPSGQMLCTCHRQKAEWYIKKGIGEMECQDPFTVRLNFEPSGVPGEDLAYYIQDKANMCVACGREDSYIRKNVVPHEYRRHFPEKQKKHTSHDVLLLCLPCHQLSSIYDRIIRQQLIDEYNAPITNTINARYREDPLKIKVRSAAKALHRHRQLKQLLPEQRVIELEMLLMEFWDIQQVNNEVIDSTIKMAVKCENKDFQGSHGHKVIAMVMKEEHGIEKFERRWRENFLATMKPRFLPALWSVHHRHTSVDSDTKLK